MRWAGERGGPGWEMAGLGVYLEVGLRGLAAKLIWGGVGAEDLLRF